MSATVPQLLEHFEAIDREHMQGLPIVNSRLRVEAVGFRHLADHQLGVLITPWFMNLVLLPGNDDWRDCDYDYEQGSIVAWTFPGGRYEFTTCRDETLGTFLTAILFRTVTDFPDQATARAVAEEVLVQLFTEAEVIAEASTDTKSLSRRELFTRLSAT